MEQCYFVPVIRIIRDNLEEGSFDSQADFLEALFDSYIRESGKGFDTSLANKWMKGTAKLSSDVCKYYRRNQDHHEELKITLEDVILPSLSDDAKVIQRVYEIVEGDVTVSEERKRQLCANYPCRSALQKAAFLADVLVFAMCRPSEQSRSSSLQERSPSAESYFSYVQVPAPCEHFCGRDQELAALHDELMDKDKVFVYGVPGIGKSELAKAYAAEHQTDYTNIIYVPFSVDLKHTIAALPGLNDRPFESEYDRYQDHMRFLRTLKRDSLLVIDNYDPPDIRESTLSELLQYSCRILITTRCCLPGKNNFRVREIQNTDDLFRIAASFYSNAERDEGIVYSAIDAVYHHTTAVELLGKLMEKGIPLPNNMLLGITAQGIQDNHADVLIMMKDGQMMEMSLFDHMHSLFSYSELPQTQRDMIRYMSLVPLTGIPPRQFGICAGLSDLNELWELVERGYLIQIPGNRIALYPLAQQVAVISERPGYRNCQKFIRGIVRSCSAAYQEEYDGMFKTAENVLELAEMDDKSAAASFLLNIFSSMEIWEYKDGMRHLYSFLRQFVHQGFFTDNQEQVQAQYLLEKYRSEFSGEGKIDWRMLHYMQLLDEGPDLSVLV